MVPGEHGWVRSLAGSSSRYTSETRFRMDKNPRARLIISWISKSMAEALLIRQSRLVLILATTTQPPRVVIRPQHRDPGWAVDEANPSARVEVQLVLLTIDFSGDRC